MNNIIIEDGALVYADRCMDKCMQIYMTVGIIEDLREPYSEEEQDCYTVAQILSLFQDLDPDEAAEKLLEIRNYVLNKHLALETPEEELDILKISDYESNFDYSRFIKQDYILERKELAPKVLIPVRDLISENFKPDILPEFNFEVTKMMYSQKDFDDLDLAIRLNNETEKEIIIEWASRCKTFPERNLENLRRNKDSECVRISDEKDRLASASESFYLRNGYTIIGIDQLKQD